MPASSGRAPPGWRQSSILVLDVDIGPERRVVLPGHPLATAMTAANDPLEKFGRKRAGIAQRPVPGQASDNSAAAARPSDGVVTSRHPTDAVIRMPASTS
jgi:hypothetical protein